MGNSQPPPIEQVEEILDEIDEAIRELRPDGDTPASDEDTADDDES